ncbi:MAG: M23 family metallopeptidase [Bacilli bacterium]
MRNDKYIMISFLTVFAVIVILLSNDIQISLNNKGNYPKKQLIAQAKIVSINTIKDHVANAQTVKGTTEIVANASVTKEDLEASLKNKTQNTSKAVETVAQNNTATSGWAWPTQAGWQISSNYGYRNDPFSGYVDFHGALDIYGPGSGSAIYASNNGVITFKGWTRSYGYHFIINHNNGYYTLYAHLSGFAPGIEYGTIVSKGQQIGYMGMTGNATGVHLHYEVWIGYPWNGGYTINPWSLY